MMQVGRRFQTFNQAIGFYSNALEALRLHDFDLRLLDDLKAPLPELFDFAQSFCRWLRNSPSGACIVRKWRTQ
jgi:hypothetical protein